MKLKNQIEIKEPLITVADVDYEKVKDNENENYYYKDNNNNKNELDNFDNFNNIENIEISTLVNFNDNDNEKSFSKNNSKANYNIYNNYMIKFFPININIYYKYKKT
jgi:hypothetical protein